MIVIVSAIPRQNGFEGESSVVRGRFSPPNRFWRVIFEHSFISQIEGAVPKSESTFLISVLPLLCFYFVRYLSRNCFVRASVG